MKSLFLLAVIVLFTFSAKIKSQQPFVVDIPGEEAFIYHYHLGEINLYTTVSNWLAVGRKEEETTCRSYILWRHIRSFVPLSSIVTDVKFFITWNGPGVSNAQLEFCDFNWGSTSKDTYNNILSGELWGTNSATTIEYSFPQLTEMVQEAVNGGISNSAKVGIRNQDETNFDHFVDYSYLVSLRVYYYQSYVDVTQVDILGEPFDQVGLWQNNDWDNRDVPFGFHMNIGQNFGLRSVQGFKLGTNQKYLEWAQNSETIVTNPNNFTSSTGVNELVSTFNNSYEGITIKNKLENSLLDNGFVTFADPWFIDYPDPDFPKPGGGYYERNRGMKQTPPDALVFYDRDSPFHPNYVDEYPTPIGNRNYKGVFLNQGWPNWEPPYYSVKASTQDVTLTNTGNPLGRNHKFYFRNWSYDANKISLQTPGSNETAVVFKTSDAVLSANLKGTNLSNDPDAYNTTSQRKFVKTDDGWLLSTHSSMGRIWFESSSDNGVTWKIANIDEQPLDNGEGKLPSITNFINYSGGFYTRIAVIIFQEKFGSGFKIKAKCYKRYDDQIAYFYQNEVTIASYTSESYSNNANPVLAVDSDKYLTFIWEQKSSNAGLYQRNEYWDASGLSSTGSIIKINFTNSSSTNPSIAISSDKKRHLVWQAPGVVNSTDILYGSFNRGGNLSLQNPSENISNGNGYPSNYSPCISLANGKPVVSWTGYFDGNLWKATGQQDEMIRIRAFVKVSGAGGWGSFTELGDNVNYVNNNSVTSASEKTVFVWSQGTTPQSKWLRRTAGAYTSICNLSHSGVENQVTMGSDFNNMTAMVFNKQTLPFYFIKSTTNFNVECADGEELNKITFSDSIISYGRSGIVSKNGIEFVFNTGDVFIADSSVRFTFIPDTLMFNSAEELNIASRTENFWLAEGVDFFFSNLYYVIRQELADSLLTEQDQVNFKVELVKVQSGDVVGTFDNITYNKNNLEKYASIHYLVNTSGIQAGEYYLRLVTTVAGEAGYNLSNIQRDEFDLNKLHYVNVSFKGETIPVTYELSQNYPNPFNPTTTIRYQIPKEGMVTLKVYDILGAEVATLVNEEKVAGKYEVSFNASSLASGVYLYKLQADEFVSVKKMILLK